MKLIDKRGNKVHLEDESLPEEMHKWLYSSVQMMPDESRLEKCWVATLCKKNWQQHNEPYEFVAEEVYDHKPTEEELLWLMAKHDAFRFSYVQVDKAYRLYDPVD